MAASREPWIVSGAGVASPGRTSDATITSPDLMPTLLEAAGLDPMPAQHADGRSFAAVLRNSRSTAGGVLALPALFQSGRAPRVQRSRRPLEADPLVRREADRLELYDLVADPAEQNDLARREPEQADRLAAVLARWLDEIEAKVPVPNPITPPCVTAPHRFANTRRRCGRKGTHARRCGAAAGFRHEQRGCDDIPPQLRSGGHWSDLTVSDRYRVLSEKVLIP